jgi:uncharacterized protein (TIGR03435 family)
MRKFIIFVTLLTASAFGKPQTSPTFEVASIKPAVFENPRIFDALSRAGTCASMKLSISANRVALSQVTLCGLIQMAYDVQKYQIYGAPDWMMKPDRSVYYEVDARAESDKVLTPDVARAMLRTLLADRFQLKLHLESREVSVYALVVGKNGPKLGTTPQGPCANAPEVDFIRGRKGNGDFLASCKPGMSMSQLVVRLTSETDRPVVDRTGIMGQHPLELHWSREGAPVDPDTPPSLFTAIQEQLGLRLESQRAQVEGIVIDSAAPPSAN